MTPSGAREQQLLERAARWPGNASWKELSAPVLADIAATEGVDFATALLYDRLVQSPEHGSFIRRVLAEDEREDFEQGDVTLALVPGACYAEYGRTGADGRRLRECLAPLGWPMETVPIASFGSLEGNARTIRDWLRTRPDGSVVLVSLSKGTADVKTALAQPDSAETFRQVRVWVSLSGIWFGTAMAGRVLSRRLSRWPVQLLCWYRGYDPAVLKAIDRQDGGPLDFDPPIPSQMQVVHVVACPLGHHPVSRSAGRCHQLLAAEGPNDGGGILLGDITRLPGLILPVWGADHYLNPPRDIRPIVRRVLGLAVEMCRVGSVASRKECCA
jgi:hypothetical protein